jgi:hypothetical protein
MFSPSESRKSVRYPLHVPVTLKVGNARISARSENISKTGILLSSDFLILKGSAVNLIVHFTRSLETGASLTARGKVLRVQPTLAGGFTMAVGCDVPFRITPPHSKR